MTRLIVAVGIAAAAGAVVGCQEPVSQASSRVTTTPSVNKAKYTLKQEPEGAVGVIIAREDAQNEDDIVLVGRIGGRENPWIEGRSAFMLIDAAVTIVADGQGSNDNEICMDDCCAALRTECTTLVKVVDDSGKPLDIDTRELLDVSEGDMVVVTGTVQRNDEAGLFTIAARGVYIRR